MKIINECNRTIGIQLVSDKVLKARLKMMEEVSPSITLQNINDLYRATYILRDLRFIYSTELPVLEVLLLVAIEFNNKGVALTCWGVCKLQAAPGNNITLTNIRLNRLVRLGLLEIAGRNVRGTICYIPTASALSAINGVVKSRTA
jgi:hypothetical protein